MQREFYQVANFPGAIGAIDCTHIAVQSPSGDQAELFRNRKSWHSLNVQVICDHKLLIRNIVARWPGSTHDARILDNSLNGTRLGERQVGGYLLAMPVIYVLHT